MATLAAARNSHHYHHHQRHMNALDRPVMTDIQNAYRPATKPPATATGAIGGLVPMMMTPGGAPFQPNIGGGAPFQPRTWLGKRSFAEISPTTKDHTTQTETTGSSSSLQPGHFCLVELLNTKDKTTISTTTANHNNDNYNHLWWPCLIFETYEANAIFEDLEIALQTKRLHEEHVFAMMNGVRAELIDCTKINLAGSPPPDGNGKKKEKKKRSLVTLLLGDELPPGYQRSYFDNASKTTAATGRGRRVFCAGAGTEWQDLLLQHLIPNHFVGSDAAQPLSRIVQKALIHNQLLMQRFVEMKPSLECDTSEVDLLALGDELMEEEEKSKQTVQRDNADEISLAPPELSQELVEEGEEEESEEVTTNTTAEQEHQEQEEESQVAPTLNLCQRTYHRSDVENPPATTTLPGTSSFAAAAWTILDQPSTFKKKKRKNKRGRRSPPPLPKTQRNHPGTTESSLDDDMEFRGDDNETVELQRPLKEEEEGATTQQQKKKKKELGRTTPSYQSKMNPDTPSDSMPLRYLGGVAKRQRTKRGKATPIRKPRQDEHYQVHGTTSESSDDGGSGSVSDSTATVETRNTTAAAAVSKKTTNKDINATTKMGTKSAAKSNKISPKGASSASVKKSNYINMGFYLVIPNWTTVREILLQCGYELNPEAKIYARPFGDPRIYPYAKLGEDYFTDMASFRAHLCAHGVEYDVDHSATGFTDDEQGLVNTWCRYSIAAEFADPNANDPNFKLPDYRMEQRKGHSLLSKKLGFKYKDKMIFRGYQWPGETEPQQLMEDQDMWIRLARFGLPKGLPLQKLEDENEVLALLLCIVQNDLAKRPSVFKERKQAPPSREEDSATENDNYSPVDEMDTDSSDANQMEMDHPIEGPEVDSDQQQQEATGTSEMDVDDSSRNASNATAQGLPELGPSSPSVPLDSEAIAHCHQAPEAVSPIDARQNLGSSFAKAQESPASNDLLTGKVTQTTGGVEQADEKRDEAENVSTAVAATNPTKLGGDARERSEMTVEEFFGDETDEESAAVQESTPEKQQESPTVESWLAASKATEEVVLPGTTAGEKLEGCLEALKTNQDDNLVVGSSLATSLDKIDAFLKDIIDSRGLLPNAYLHVCGGPGVGKTAGINACVKKMKQYWSDQASNSIDKSFLDMPNFLILKGSEFQNLSKEDAMAKMFGQSVKRISFKTLQKPADLEGSKKAAVILVLDEVDMLISKQGTEEYLREVIRHAADENMMFGMVGISNSIENVGLNKLGFSGQRVVFGTYDKEDLVEMMTSKIGKEVVDETVLTFLASKVSSTSGDIRSMLGIVAKAVEACQNKLPTSKLDAPLTGPIVRMPHATIAAKALSTKVMEVINSLPQYERFVLCCGVNLSGALMGHELTLESFHKLFTYALGYDLQLTYDDFTGILDRLADKDLLKYDRENAKGPFGYRSKIHLDLPLDDVVSALENGLQKEEFYKKMKQRCGEIAQSMARQQKQS